MGGSVVFIVRESQFFKRSKGRNLAMPRHCPGVSVKKGCRPPIRWEGEAPAEPLSLSEFSRPSGSAGASPSREFFTPLPLGGATAVRNSVSIRRRPESYDTNSLTTSPPSITSIGRPPGAMSSLSALIPICL